MWQLNTIDFQSQNLDSNGVCRPTVIAGATDLTLSDIDDLVQDYSLSSALALEMLQPFTEPLINSFSETHMEID